MDKGRAEDLLDKVFNSPYSHEKYEEFIVHLLNNVKINRADCNSFVEGYREFSGFIENFKHFGRYKDNSGKTADILSIKLAKDNSKIRARVMQRNIIAKWLKRTGSNCALVAFYDDTEDWRFSFVELEYKTVRLKYRVKDEVKLSPAKRLSFLVGRNEPNHTCKKYLLDFIIEDSKLPGLDSIRSAFSIENVSKEFFDKYRELYKELLASLETIISKDELIKSEFKSKYISPNEFAKKLLGQIVFIYFLQKKGWLGVSKNGKWGEGRKDFLRAVFEGKFNGYDNFFNDVLEPLFYNAFANSERDNDYYDKFDCRIPFLNGGLFEPIGGYDWVSTDITIDNAIFARILKTFDEFNFTIKEDEPLEKEVAVDPEMLGKIFENLLEDNLRKGYGAFYTPREIVHYMCQETLVNYLDDNSGADRSVIDALVRQGSAVFGIRTYEAHLEKQAGGLDKLLADIRVVDPAVGSGAFPVGMLSEIVNARLVLGELINGERQTPYQLKRAAIENSLYGVDIDPGAVDIAKLRFWLSLVIDEDSEDHIDPLPNLEQKIMCGDSLLESFCGVKLFDDSLIEKDIAFKTRSDVIKAQVESLYDKLKEVEFGIDTGDIQCEIDKLKKEQLKLKREQRAAGDQATVLVGGNFGVSEAKKRLRKLKRLQHEFFNETFKSRKEKLRKEIDNFEWKFIEDSLQAGGHGDEPIEEIRKLKKKRCKPFFLWRLYFSEVFLEKGGFDIVIGNPPYGAKIEKDSMKELKKNFIDNNNTNSAAIFIDYSKNNLLNNNGILSFIVPKSLLYSEKWFMLVDSMLHNVSVLVDVEKAFGRVKLEQTVFVYAKNKSFNKYNAKKFLDHKFLFTTSIPCDLVLKYKAWICGVRQNELDIVNRLNKKLIYLGNISKTKRGIGVQRYLSNKGDIEVIGGKNIDRYRVSGNRGKISNFILSEYSKKRSFMQQKKLISQDLIAHIQNPHPHIKIISYYDSEGKYIGLDTVQNTIIENQNYSYEYILGLLNSTFVSWFTYKFIYCSAIRTMHFDNAYIGKIIIPDISLDEQKPIIERVQKIIEKTKLTDYHDNNSLKNEVLKFQLEIDNIVYELYGLTDEEISIVEGTG